jgi:hypothetical protein
MLIWWYSGRVNKSLAEDEIMGEAWRRGANRKRKEVKKTTATG